MAETASPSATNFLAGNGEIYMAELDADGLPLGQVHVGNCTSFAVSTEVQSIDKRSRMTESRGVLLQIASQRTPKLAITADEITLRNMALHLLADRVAYTQSSGTFTDEGIVPSDWEYGLWYKLTNRDISSVVVEHVVAEVDTALVLGEDYELNLAEGMIRFIDGGDAVEGELIKVSGNKAAIASTKLGIATRSDNKRYVRFVGDPTHGPTYVAELWCVNFMPSGALDLIQPGETDLASLALEGTVLEDTTNHPTSPFGDLILRS